MPTKTAAPAPSGPHTLGRTLDVADTFTARHLGPRPGEIQEMLGALGYKTLDEFIDTVVPEGIRLRRPLDLRRDGPDPRGGGHRDRSDGVHPPMCFV